MRIDFDPWPYKDEKCKHDIVNWNGESLPISIYGCMNKKDPDTMVCHLKIGAYFSPSSKNLIESISRFNENRIRGAMDAFIINAATRHPKVFEFWRSTKGTSRTLEMKIYLDPIWKEKYPEIFI